MINKVIIKALCLIIFLTITSQGSQPDSQATAQIMDLPLDGGATYHFLIFAGKQTDNPFRMAVIGDSIAWGNGLNQIDKYYDQVAERLHKKLNRPVEVTVYAHSGAVIFSDATGESKNANLGSSYPTLIEQAENIQDNVDLILVSGGINDVGLGNILDPNTPEGNIRSLSESITGHMKKLLQHLLEKTSDKGTCIIVTGYYHLITEESKLEPQDRVIGAFLSLTSEKTKSEALKVLASACVDPTLSAAKKQAAISSAEALYNNAISMGTEDSNLRTNSDTFYLTSTNSLDTAVKDANKGQNRVIFIDPMFERTNSYRASGSFLWELNSDYKSNDDQYYERYELTKNIVNPATKFKDSINAIGHPNVKGASKYADLIEASLKSRIPGWSQTAPATEKPTSAAVDALSIGSGTLEEKSIENVRKVIDSYLVLASSYGSSSISYDIIDAKSFDRKVEAARYMNDMGITYDETQVALAMIDTYGLEDTGFCIVIVEYNFVLFGQDISVLTPAVCDENGESIGYNAFQELAQGYS